MQHSLHVLLTRMIDYMETPDNARDEGDTGEKLYRDLKAARERVVIGSDAYLMAVEFGVRCSEKGMNLQAALKAYEEL